MRRHGPVIAHCTDSEDFPIHGLVDLNSADFLGLPLLLPVVIASNCKKTSLVSRLDARKFCFSNRVDAWNHLPDHVV